MGTGTGTDPGSYLPPPALISCLCMYTPQIGSHFNHFQLARLHFVSVCVYAGVGVYFCCSFFKFFIFWFHWLSIKWKAIENWRLATKCSMFSEKPDRTSLCRNDIVASIGSGIGIGIVQQLPTITRRLNCHTLTQIQTTIWPHKHTLIHHILIHTRTG